MQYTRLGGTGLTVSRICLGMMSYGTPDWRDWVLDEDASRPFIRHAVESGINFFDTADSYSLGMSEEITGRALKDFAKREEIVVATKVYFPMTDKPNMGGLSRKHIMDSIDASLRRLGMDYVDIYQMHRVDYNTPFEETMEALHDVVKSGKARYIGASSMYAWQFAKMQHIAALHGWTQFVAMQNHYNLIYREEEREMIPQCIDQGVGCIPWSPLARGFLARKGTGDTTRAGSDTIGEWLYGGYTDADFAVQDAVNALAEQRGVTAAQVALAWVMHKPGVSAPIIGATKMPHLEQAIAAVEIALSDEDIAQLEAPYQPRAISGHE